MNDGRDDELIERLAELSHRQWAGWASWMIQMWDQEREVGPGQWERYQDRWARQIATPYSDLSPAEQESDRAEARHILAVVRSLPGVIDDEPTKQGGASASKSPTVVDIRDVASPGQPLPRDVVYIGRACHLGGWRLDASPWANPFNTKRLGRDEALRRYREERLFTRRRLATLAGQRLACWCKRDGHRCHGDVLVEIGAELGLWEIEEG